jgi:hypothetical protein
LNELVTRSCQLCVGLGKPEFPLVSFPPRRERKLTQAVDYIS